jgi:hypothetical protein
MLYRLTGETQDGAKPRVVHVVARDGDDALEQGKRLFDNPRHLSAERLPEADQDAPTTLTCRGCGRALTAERVVTDNGPGRKYCGACSR